MLRTFVFSSQKNLLETSTRKLFGYGFVRQNDLQNEVDGLMDKLDNLKKGDLSLQEKLEYENELRKFREKEKDVAELGYYKYTPIILGAGLIFSASAHQNDFLVFSGIIACFCVPRARKSEKLIKFEERIEFVQKLNPNYNNPGKDSIKSFSLFAKQT